MRVAFCETRESAYSRWDTRTVFAFSMLRLKTTVHAVAATTGR